MIGVVLATIRDVPNHTLIELRDSLSTQHRGVLDEIWNHFERTGEFIPVPVLRHKHARPTVEGAADSLGGRVLMEGYSDGKRRYMLTLLGALLSSSGDNLESMLERCLAYVLRRYEQTPEIHHITGDEIGKGCDLDTPELLRLRRLTSLYGQSALVRSSGGSSDGSWLLLIDEDIDTLRDVSDLRAWIRDQAMKNYDPSYPVSEAQRVALTMPDPLAMIDGDTESFHALKGTTTGLPHEDPLFTVPLDLSHVRDVALRTVILSDWTEVPKVVSVGAWKSCVMLCGSILEGLLLSLIRTAAHLQGEAAKQSEKSQELGLARLLKICHERGLLTQESALLGEFIRLHRNLIHPGLHSGSGRVVGREEAMIAANAVRSIARKLESMQVTQ